MSEKIIHKRGAFVNPANRFENISFERDEEISDMEPRASTPANRLKAIIRSIISECSRQAIIV